MSNESIVKFSSHSSIDEVIIVISQDKASLGSIQVKNCVSISINEVVSLALFEIYKPLHLLCVIDVCECRIL